MIIPNVPMADYVADRAEIADGIRPASLNSSLAHCLLTKSPAHVRIAHPRLNPAWQPEEDGRFDLGAAAHAVLLEGRRDLLAVCNFSDWRTKLAQQARDDARAQGKIPVLLEQAAAIEQMVDAAQAKLAASPDLKGLGALKAEQTILWQQGDTWCRTRPDWMSVDHAILLSVKTTAASAEPDAFLRLILNSGYDVQAAFELAGVQAATGVTPHHYVWVVIETDAPYAVSLIGLSPMLRDLAERKFARAVQLWAHCLTADAWPDYGEHIVYPDPPEWALSKFIDQHGYQNPDPDDGRNVSDQLMELR